VTGYHRPGNLDQALHLLDQGGLTVAAGCTDLYPLTTQKTLPGNVLDIMGLDELRGIGRSGGFWRIGATTTWTDIIHTALPPTFEGLKLAAKEVGSVQIQNVATIAGNLCTASPAADGVPCLLTLDAQIELRSLGGTRILPLSEFLTGPRKNALARNELVTAILIPDRVAGQGYFLKLGSSLAFRHRKKTEPLWL